jgi:hypothetical protein
MKSERLNVTWKKGMTVVKVVRGGGGYREAVLGTVSKVDSKKGIVYFEDETGITYDRDGNERENFFPPLHASLTPITRSHIKGVEPA